MAACDRFNVVPGVEADSEVTLGVDGPEGAFETVARLESGDEFRKFTHQALAGGTARFTARREFYVVTFFTKFLAPEETTATLSVRFSTGQPADIECTLTGRRGDETAMTIFDLEVEA